MKLSLGALALLAVGCPSSSEGGPRFFEAEIGPEGGVLAGGGVTLTVPAGALTETQTLSVRVGAATDQELSPLYRFEPEGLVFAELALVQVEIEDEGLGTMLWSLPDDPDQYESIGLAAGGLAEGYTSHFSSMYVGEGVCERELEEPAPPALQTVCSCRATDEQGDLLCSGDPDQGQDCELSGFTGTDGLPCSGYGQRSVEISTCDCYNHGYGFLCPEPYIFDPQQQCPSGLNGFEGLTLGVSCQGYTAENDLLSGYTYSCATVFEDPTYEQLSGVLEDCHEVAAPAPVPAAANRCITSKDSWTDECLQVLERYDDKRTEACPELGKANTVGSTAGKAIEDLWVGAQPGRLRQLEVPYANKDDCQHNVKHIPSRRPGNLDIVEITAVTPTAVTIRLAEVKPLTRSGLDLGWEEVYECYIPVLKHIMAICTATPIPTEARKFCDKLGAQGKTVLLDAVPGIVWDETLTIPGVTIETCAEGLVGYSCEDPDDFDDDDDDEDDE